MDLENDIPELLPVPLYSGLNDGPQKGMSKSLQPEDVTLFVKS